MNVFLTIDVECYSGDYEAEVFGDGLGLPFILETCRRYDQPATFFVEALGATQWGGDGVNRICRDIIRHQQDIQLHIHPSVAKVDGLPNCDDLFHALEISMQAHLLDLGKTILHACGAPAVTVFRAGDLAADGDTLVAMEQACLYLGSNRDLDGKSTIRSKLNSVFPVTNDISSVGKQIDLPVTVMRSPLPFLDGAVRHFEISALGAAEMRHGVRRLRKEGYETVTILTHPGEFFRRVNGRYLPIMKNCRRWLSFLEFLSKEPDIQVRHMGKGTVPSLPDKSPVIPIFNPFFSLMRVIEQGQHRLWARRMGVRP